jgi:hypothetical protein
MKVELLDFKIERSDKSKMKTKAYSYIRFNDEHGYSDIKFNECDAYTYKITISLDVDNENIYNLISKLSTNIKQIYRNKLNFTYTKVKEYTGKDSYGNKITKPVYDKNFDKFPVFDFTDAPLISQKLDKLIADKIKRLDMIIYCRNNLHESCINFKVKDIESKDNDKYYYYDDYVFIINDIVIPHKYFFGRGPFIINIDSNFERYTGKDTSLYNTKIERHNILLLRTFIEIIFISLDNTNKIKMYEMLEDSNITAFPNTKLHGGEKSNKNLQVLLKSLMKILIKNGTIKYKFRYDGLLNFKKKPTMPITTGLEWNTYDDYYKNKGGKLLKRTSSKRKSSKRKSSKRNSKKKN